MPNAWDAFVLFWATPSSPLTGPSQPHRPPAPDCAFWARLATPLSTCWREKGLGRWESVPGITRYVGPCMIAEKGQESVSWCHYAQGLVEAECFSQ